MKGVVLAGGTGSRLNPLTKVTNKHLLPVYDKPMVYYPIQTLVNAGIEEILLVTGGKNAGDFLRLLGNGRDFGLKHLNYTYQEGEGGIAEALGLAEFFAGRADLRGSGRQHHRKQHLPRSGKFQEAERRRQNSAEGSRRRAAFRRRGDSRRSCARHRGKTEDSQIQLRGNRHIPLRRYRVPEDSPLKTLRPRRTRNHRRQQFLYRRR